MDQTSLLDGYQYHIDVATEERVAGWAFKVGDESHHPVVEIRSGDAVLWQTKASQYREDLEAAGFGNGEFGFVLVPSANTLLHSVTSASIYIDDMLVQADIPFVMEVADSTVIEVLSVESTQTAPLADYRVILDHFDAETIRGWAFRNGHEGHRPSVEVRSGEVVIASGVADGFREDLLNADIGDGAYGFSLIPNVAAFVSTQCECELYVDGELSSVGQFILEVDQDRINGALYEETFADEMADFTEALKVKIAELKANVVSVNRDASRPDLAVDGQLTVAMDEVAELSVRIKVIENVLMNHFLGK